MATTAVRHHATAMAMVACGHVKPIQQIQRQWEGHLKQQGSKNANCLTYVSTQLPTPSGGTRVVTLQEKHALMPGRMALK